EETIPPGLEHHWCSPFVTMRDRRPLRATQPTPRDRRDCDAACWLRWLQHFCQNVHPLLSAGGRQGGRAPPSWVTSFSGRDEPWRAPGRCCTAFSHGPPRQTARPIFVH